MHLYSTILYPFFWGGGVLPRPNTLQSVDMMSVCPCNRFQQNKGAVYATELTYSPLELFLSCLSLNNQKKFQPKSESFLSVVWMKRADGSTTIAAITKCGVEMQLFK